MHSDDVPHWCCVAGIRSCKLQVHVDFFHLDDAKDVLSPLVMLAFNPIARGSGGGGRGVIMARYRTGTQMRGVIVSFSMVKG